MRARTQKETPFGIQPLDQHPDILRMQCKRAVLADKLTEAQTEHARLLAERDRVKRERHQAGVAAVDAGRDNPDMTSFDTQLPEVESAIGRAADRIAYTGEALTRHDELSETVRLMAVEDMRARLAQAGREVATAMMPALRLLEERNADLEQLYTLASQVSGASLPFMLPPGILAVWVGQMAPYEAQTTATQGADDE